VLDDGRVVEFGAVQHEESKEKFQGRPHDLVGFDELPHFTRAQYRFLIGWNRPDDDYTGGGQPMRCRVVCTGNPPTNPEGRWVVEEWAPWLDREFPDPAEPGELRHYAVLDGVHRWLRPGVEFTHQPPGAKAAQTLCWAGPGHALEYTNERGEKESITPRSRTFIPGRVDDNPVLLKQGYKATLQGMPEPLRSQMLYGDFNAGVQDDAWQVIPTEWVRAAQARWRPDGRAKDQDGVPVPLTVCGVDVAHGGPAQTVISKRYGNWFAPLTKYRGKQTPDGRAAVLLVKKDLVEAGDPPSSLVYIDSVGVGASAYDESRNHHPEVRFYPFKGGASTGTRDRSRLWSFQNMRAYAYWNLRELLDPNSGQDIALPPDQEMLADLCCVRWEPRGMNIVLEPKEDIEERLGRSIDAGDAVCMAALPARGDWKLESY
jgi:hypothetical protein